MEPTFDYVNAVWRDLLSGRMPESTTLCGIQRDEMTVCVHILSQSDLPADLLTCKAERANLYYFKPENAT